MDYPDRRPNEDGTATGRSPSIPKDAAEPMEKNLENDRNEKFDERKVLMKIDLRLLPITTAIYVMAFLDRYKTYPIQPQNAPLKSPAK